MLLFLPFILHLFLLSQGYLEGSGCQDQQENADLCLEGSGSGFGSGDVSMEDPGEITPKTVCRSSSLVTWKPTPVRRDRTKYQMVQDCANVELSSEGIASKCKPQPHPNDRILADVPAWLPVISTATNVTYYNRYCFLCSGDPGPGAVWAVSISCSEWVDLQSLDSENAVLRAASDSGHCSLELQPPPGARPEECRDGPPGQQGEQGQQGQDRPPEISRHGSPLSALLRFRFIGSRDGEEGGGGGPAGREEEGGERGSPAPCAGFVVRRFDEEICLPMSCAPGKRLEEDTCQPVIGRSRGLQYSLTLLIDLFVRSSDVMGGVTPESLSSLCSLEELIKAGVTQKTPQLHSEAYNLTGWIVSAHKHATLTSFDAQNDDADDLYFDDSASVLEYQDDFFNNVTMTVKEFRLGQVLIWFDFFVTTDADRNDVERTAVCMTEEDWHVVCGNAVARLVPVRKIREEYIVVNDTTNQLDKTVSPKVFKESVMPIQYKTMWEKRKSVPMAITPFLICPFLTFANEQYSISLPDTSEDNTPMVNLTLMNETQTVRLRDVETDKDGNIKLCRHLFLEKFSKLLEDKDTTTEKPEQRREVISFWVLVEHYISLVCVSLSLVCLLLTIITYSLFRSLRSIPGQNTIALCCNLFLAQALLQFGVNWPELRVGCIILGMLIHYFWLSSILWMNVSSFHMHRVFTARHAASRMGSTHVRCCARRFAAYVVYAQGVPLVVIGATVSVSIFVFQGKQMGYGGDLCYLSKPVLVGAAFAAPLGFVLILNLIFFLGAVRAITKTESPLREANLQNGHRSPSPNLHTATPFPSPWRRNLNVCIRLSSLTGLFWALGLIAELLDLQVLRMVSVMVNGSQGVLIAASYLPTRRVLRLYAQLCCTCKGERQQSSTSHSVPGSSPSSNLAATVTTSLRNVPREIIRNPNNSDV